MSQEIHGYWLGKKAVQVETNRMPFPQAIFDLEIAKLDRHGYWGFDRDTNYVVFTRDPDLLRDNPEFGFRGEAKVYKNGIATIPLQFFGEEHYDGAADGSTPVEEKLQFDFDQPRVFYTTDKLAEDDACHILTSRQWLDIAPGEQDTELIADGGQLRNEFRASTLREKLSQSNKDLIPRSKRANPDAFVNEHEILDVATGVIYQIPKHMWPEGRKHPLTRQVDDWDKPGRMEAVVRGDEVVRLPSGEVVRGKRLNMQMGGGKNSE